MCGGGRTIHPTADALFSPSLVSCGRLALRSLPGRSDVGLGRHTTLPGARDGLLSFFSQLSKYYIHGVRALF